MQSPTEQDAKRVTPAALADLLEQHKDSLLEKWAGRVLRDPDVPSAAPLSHLALYDHFPAIVDRIVTLLRTFAEHPEELGATMGSTEEAHDHVRDRAHADYSAPEVLRELSHLRLAILELCWDDGMALDRASGATLHAVFDHMMIHAADDLSRLEFDARRRAEALARERAVLYERERVAREELEQAQQSKDNLLATISHELRTPLNAIAGWSEMLSRNGGDPALRARAVAIILRNAKAQGHLIDSVLDITRLTGGRASLDREPLDLAALARSIIESFTPAVTEKRLTLRTTIPEVAPTVLGDGQRMRQVLSNLIANAIKFTPAGGAIDVILDSDGTTVRVEVSDTGQGISPAFLPHVFEPFRQADGSWAREHGGLGLGLAISKALVEAHAGTIEATSEGDGRGATFVVCLPVAPVSPASRPQLDGAKDAEESRLDGVRILVVDDAPDARELLGALLQAAGATVDMAGSASDALELARRNKPDVVISDLAMPHVDGLGFIRRLQAQVGDIPAIAISAFTAPSAVADAKAAGFRIYLPKPVVVPDLLEHVRKIAAAN